MPSQTATTSVSLPLLVMSQRPDPCQQAIRVADRLVPPPPAVAVRAFSHSDPLPSAPTPDRRATKSAESPKPTTDAIPRPKFTYPRFSMVTTLANTGGPGFSIEELTSTEVSEDENDLMHEPCLRRRTLSRISWQPPTLPDVPSEPELQLPSDRFQKTAEYVRHVLASLLEAFMAYLRATDKPDAGAGTQHTNPPEPCDQPGQTDARSI
ncbi:hypothetical protein DV735_g635, partial [Chaetothyriales sp. CBS 134920]